MFKVIVVPTFDHHCIFTEQREVVAKLGTEPAMLKAWFWRHLNAPVAIDLWVSGRFEIESVVPGVAVSGRYLMIDPTEHLVFTWQ